jgi:FkbM family methyltransferase
VSNCELRTTPLREPERLIIDAGAYIGDATVWYFNGFPPATAIALEPNPSSVSMFERDCRKYGRGAILLQAVVWPCLARLELNEGSETTGASVRQVTTSASNRCVSVTVDELLSQWYSDRGYF